MQRFTAATDSRRFENHLPNLIRIGAVGIQPKAFLQMMAPQIATIRVFQVKQTQLVMKLGVAHLNFHRFLMRR